MGSDRRGEIVQAARELLEEEGPGGLTMRRLGERLGVRAPSLYKHFAGKDELEAALMADGLEEIGLALAEAVTRAGGEPIAALASAYRRYALAHRHLYRLTTEQPLPRDRRPDGLEQRATAPAIQAAGDPDRARALWAFLHGMVQLELAGWFPPDADLDAAWREGLAGFARWPAQPRMIVRSWRGPDRRLRPRHDTRAPPADPPRPGGGQSRGYGPLRGPDLARLSRPAAGSLRAGARTLTRPLAPTLSSGW